MKSITHGPGARDPLLHIEADGVLVNIRVGLTDSEGHRITRVDISPDDESRGGDGEGRYWYQDGPRIIRLHPGEEPPAPDGAVDKGSPAERSGYNADETIHQAGQRQADAVLSRLQRGEVNESTPYAVRTLFMREFTLAGGGPGLDVTFVTDPSEDEVLEGSEDEVLEGWFTYYEATNVRIPLPLSTAMSLYEALNHPTEG